MHIFKRRVKQCREEALGRIDKLPGDILGDEEARRVMEAWATVWQPNDRALHPDSQLLVRAAFTLAGIVLPKASSVRKLPENLFDGLHELQELSVHRAVLHHQYSNIRKSKMNKNALRKKLDRLDKAMQTRLELICDEMSLVYSSEVVLIYLILYRDFVLSDNLN
jgi:hypothetical protein